jgi:AcrR family transcriptional regulator
MARAPLDRARIYQAALAFVDQHGLEGLSMRKLGATLGVEAMALYHYVPSKAALLDGVVGLVLGQLPLPLTTAHGPAAAGAADIASTPDAVVAAAADWPELIRQVARAFCQLGRRHPNVFPLLATVGFDNPATLAPAEAIVATLARAGLETTQAFDAFVALKSYVVGHVLWANAAPDSPPAPDGLPAADGRPATDGHPSADRRPATLRPWPAIAAADYPCLADHFAATRGPDLDAEFEAGLDLLIGGIRARLG